MNMTASGRKAGNEPPQPGLFRIGRGLVGHKGGDGNPDGTCKLEPRRRKLQVRNKELLPEVLLKKSR